MKKYKVTGSYTINVEEENKNMFIIKRKCYDFNLGVKPYWDYIEKQFNSSQEAYNFALAKATEEVNKLNEKGTPMYNHFTLNDTPINQKCACIVEWWEKEIEYPNDNDCRPVTEYYIVKIPSDDTTYCKYNGFWIVFSKTKYNNTIYKVEQFDTILFKHKNIFKCFKFIDDLTI